MRERPSSDATTSSTARGWDRFERSAPPGQPQRMARLLDKLERFGNRLADGDNVQAQIGKVLARLESLFSRYTRPTTPAPAPAPAPDAAAPPTAPTEPVAPPAAAPTTPSTDPVRIAALPFAEPVATTSDPASAQSLDLVA